MENIYENLENYQDDKIIDELKNENKDLKAQVEEYSNAMQRIQNDFDKLSSEYKKLELNYSSLLKTARAEIERKSEMINTLNKEKDLLVIKSLQNSGIKKFNCKTPNFTGTEFKDKSQQKREQVLNSQFDVRSHKSERISSTHTQLEDTTVSHENKSYPSTEKATNKCNNQSNNKDGHNQGYISEEIYKDLLKFPKTKGQNILNRRKSMPLNRIEPIYSSDDDFETLNQRNPRKSPLKEYDKRYKNHSEKGSSYDMFKDRHRGEKYNSNQKYKRTPDRGRNKHTKEYADKNHTGNFSKQRVLRSPAKDKYNNAKDRDRWDRRFDRDSYYDNCRYNTHPHDYSGSKHKIRNELDEPRNKRRKMDTIYNRNTIEENTGHNKKEEFRATDSCEKSQDCIKPLSNCIELDPNVPHIVTEVKQKSSVPLEDPRPSSKQYAIQNNKEKSVVSTIASEYVDIIPVNVTSWDIPNVNKFILPEESGQNAVNKTCKDFNESDMLNSKQECLKNNNSLPIVDSGLNENELNKNNKKEDALLKINVNHSNKLLSSNKDTNKYKSAKLKRKDDSSAVVKDNNSESSSKENCSDNISSKDITKNNSIEGGKYGKTITSISEAHTIENTKNIEPDTSLKTTCNNKKLLQKSPVSLVTLANDLELSDEASDSKDFHKLFKKTKRPSTKDKSISSSKVKTEQTFLPPNNKKGSETEMMKSTTSKITLKDFTTESSKLRKSKKKIERNEEGNILTANKIQKDLKLIDNDQKPKISTPIRNKFSDLFGDTNSLITPDDLDIPASDMQLPLINVSVYDNTQDALDFNVNSINKLQSNTTQCKSIQNIQEEICSKKSVIETPKPIEDCQKSKDCVKDIEQNNILANNLYENTKSEMSDASEIVKTVIISTGMQPNYKLDDIAVGDQSQKDPGYSENTNIINITMDKSVLTNIKELATFTPQKVVNQNVVSPIPDLSSQNECSIAENDLSNLSKSDKNSNATNDVPDVRIFVKRRRKFTKKP